MTSCTHTVNITHFKKKTFYGIIIIIINFVLYNYTIYMYFPNNNLYYTSGH